MNTIKLKIALPQERTYWTKNEVEANLFAKFVNGKVKQGFTGIYFIYV